MEAATHEKLSHPDSQSTEQKQRTAAKAIDTSDDQGTPKKIGNPQEHSVSDGVSVGGNSGLYEDARRVVDEGGYSHKLVQYSQAAGNEGRRPNAPPKKLADADFFLFLSQIILDFLGRLVRVFCSADLGQNRVAFTYPTFHNK